MKKITKNIHVAGAIDFVEVSNIYANLNAEQIRTLGTLPYSLAHSLAQSLLMIVKDAV